MARILAIEPDLERGTLLRRLVAESLGLGIALVSSADEAITSICDSRPDVVLISSLLPASEEAHLAMHLRLAPDLDHMPVLTIPPLVETVGSNDVKNGLLARLRRLLRRQRQRQFVPTYDFSAVAARIEDALEQSRFDADLSGMERPARLLLLEAYQPLLLAVNPTNEPLTASLRLVQPDDEVDLATDMDGRIYLPRAKRWTDFDLPWLDAVKLTWGADIRLLNISRSGLLLESGFRFALGNRTDFNLVGPGHDLVVHARVVRSRRANATHETFVTAATFEEPFERLDPGGILRAAQLAALSRTA